MKGARTRIARWSTAVTRETVYQTANGIEVDSSEQFELVRRRVFFDDVRLVTYHRIRGTAFLLTTGILALFFVGMAVIMTAVSDATWAVALIFLAFALPFLIAFTLRLIVGVDVITVFGRRSKAVLRFSFRKERARQVYGTICAAVRNAQRVRPATSPGTSPGTSPAPTVEMPPWEKPPQPEEPAFRWPEKPGNAE